DATLRLLPLQSDSGDDLVRPQTLRKDPLSKVVRPVANRRWRQREHERERVALTDDVDAYHVLACLAATATFVAAPLVEWALGASLGTAGPGDVRIRSGYTRLSVHARTCRRPALAGKCRR